MNRFRVATGTAFVMLSLASCSGDSADRDGNGVVDSEERKLEMEYDAFIPMKAGMWETKFTFSDLDVPTLGKAQRRQVMEEVAKGAANRTCLSVAEARRPGPDFFGGKGAEKCVYKKFDVSGQNVKMTLSCATEGMGSVDMDLSGVMGESEFTYDSAVALRLPMVGKVKMKGKATGRHIGSCLAP